MLKKRHTLKYGDGSALSWRMLMKAKADGGEYCRCKSQRGMQTIQVPSGAVLFEDCLKCKRPIFKANIPLCVKTDSGETTSNRTGHLGGA